MKKMSVCFLYTILLLIMVVSSGTVWASCGSSNCFLVVGTQEGITSPDQMILDLSYRFIPMDRIHKGSSNASEALVPKIDFGNGTIIEGGHREIRTNNELAQLDISYGVTPSFAMMFSIPFFNLRTHEHFHDDGTFSRQDGTSGLGDVRLIGKYVLWIDARHLIVGGLGVKTPTGEYKLLDHDGEINEPTIMPGTGSWDGLVSLHYSYQVHPVHLETFLSGSYQVNTANDLDYKFGNTLLLNGGISYPSEFKTKAASFCLQLNMRQSLHDEFKGMEVHSTGGKWVYITPGIKMQVSDTMMMYSHLQLPVYQYVNEVNIVPRYGFIMGVSYSF